MTTMGKNRAAIRIDGCTQHKAGAFDLNDHLSTGRELLGKRITLIAMYYWPEETGSGPYTAELAEHLASLGAHVDVVAAPAHYPNWRRLPGSPNRWRSEMHHDVRIRRVPVFVPRRPSAPMRLLYELSFCLTAFPVLTSARPDLVIGTSPSILSALLARLLAGAARCPLVVVTQDVVSAAAEQTELAVSRTFSKLLAKVESFALRSAALVTVPAPKLRLALGRIGVRPEAIHTIRNWPRRFPTASTADFRARYGWEHRIVIMHTGNIGLKQSLDELVETARLMQVRRPEVVFAIFGHGNQYESLARIAGPIDNIELHPPVPAEDYVALLTSADYLLVHERSTVRDMSLPSKLTSYVQAARPIIAVTHPNSSTASEVRRIGAGVIVPPRDREAFLAALEDLMENVDRREELAMAARSHYGKELSSTPGLSRLAELIANTLSLKSSCTSTHISCSTRPSPTGR